MAPSSSTDPRSGDLYDGWFESILHHLKREVGELRGLENLEIGVEFEIALCHALQKLLPERAGICRGWVVEAGGRKAGDDIIIYEATRFPTLRALRGNIAIKEHVPAEAVLAYIEVKHTLHVQARASEENEGSSLAKACRQVEAIKSLERRPVPLETFLPRFELPKAAIPQRPGYPGRRNPWYAAVWARRLVVDKELEDSPASALSLGIDAITDPPIPWEQLPDVIAAGQVVMMPALTGVSGHPEFRPFVTQETRLSCMSGLLPDDLHALGLGVAHLIWAIDDILLGELPWTYLLYSQLAKAEERGGETIDLPPPSARPPT